MNFDLRLLCFARPAVLFAGMSKGRFGAGVAVASSSVFTVAIEPEMASETMLRYRPNA